MQQAAHGQLHGDSRYCRELLHHLGASGVLARFHLHEDPRRIETERAAARNDVDALIGSRACVSQMYPSAVRISATALPLRDPRTACG